jgi:hypothetical protein
LNRYLTESGRAKSDGPLAAAQRDLTKQRTAEDDLRVRMGLLESHFQELALLRTQRAHLSHPTQIAQAEAELADTERLLKEGQDAATLVRGQESLERAAFARLETVKQRLNDIRDAVERIDACPRGR